MLNLTVDCPSGHETKEGSGKALAQENLRNKNQANLIKRNKRSMTM